jgi:hypothetical protein
MGSPTCQGEWAPAGDHCGIVPVGAAFPFNSGFVQGLEHLFAQLGADPNIGTGCDFLDEQFGLVEGKDAGAESLGEDAQGASYA